MKMISQMLNDYTRKYDIDKMYTVIEQLKGWFDNVHNSLI